MACVMPVMVLSLKYMVMLFRKRAVLSQKMYAEAGAVAEETLGSIRTVASQNGEKRAIDKYNERAVQVETGNIAISKKSACVFGCMMGASGSCFLWRVDGNDLAFADFPNITAVAEAKGAAAAIYKILDTMSAIDASKTEGDKPGSCAGRIQAVGVNFTYRVDRCADSNTTTSPLNLVRLSPLLVRVEVARVLSSRYLNASTILKKEPYCLMVGMSRL
ncbi:ABC transporter type 1, transmembrane domain [Phytophthora cactorum]|nr:ABC transporter type 1, transmembrane domain [Phytophthora cactorum]